MNLFDEIRSACRDVAEGATFLRIDRTKLPDYARSLGSAERPNLDPSAHFLGHGERTLASILILDTINFGSGWFPELRKRTGKSGSVTLASWLREGFAAGQDFSASKLAEISARDCARIFDQDLRVPSIAELMEKFADALNQLGHLVVEQFHGNYAALVESANESAESLVAILRTMPFFEDVETWRGRRVPFYKRAQLTTAKLALAFDHSGWGKFRDLDKLTIFADNLVAHVRVDGVLLYGQDLAARIDREELIAAGSAEEVEIRACALHAVELIAGELRKTGRGATAMDLDNVLWNRGQSSHYKSAKPRHRTRTVFY
ncbi:MAG: queuosine salvage family protein [Candidatus Binataceae bacterium]